MGFSQKGMFLSRNMKDTLVVLEIQKDRKYGSKDGIRFTINVGISVSALHRDDVAFGDASGEKIPTPEMCHWRQRLGHITQAHRDVWWNRLGRAKPLIAGVKYWAVKQLGDAKGSVNVVDR